MFRSLVVLITLITAFCISLPAFAQDSDEFFSVLRENLEGETASEDAGTVPSKIRVESQPEIGASDILEGASVPKPATETYGAYDAGKESVSGAVAASAAFLAVLVIVFIFALALTNRQENKE